MTEQLQLQAQPGPTVWADKLGDYWCQMADGYFLHEFAMDKMRLWQTYNIAPGGQWTDFEHDKFFVLAPAEAESGRLQKLDPQPDMEGNSRPYRPEPQNANYKRLLFFADMSGLPHEEIDKALDKEGVYIDKDNPEFPELWGFTWQAYMRTRLITQIALNKKWEAERRAILKLEEEERNKAAREKAEEQEAANPPDPILTERDLAAAYYKVLNWAAGLGYEPNWVDTKLAQAGAQFCEIADDHAPPIVTTKQLQKVVQFIQGIEKKPVPTDVSKEKPNREFATYKNFLPTQWRAKAEEVLGKINPTYEEYMVIRRYAEAYGLSPTSVFAIWGGTAEVSKSGLKCLITQSRLKAFKKKLDSVIAEHQKKKIAEESQMQQEPEPALTADPVKTSPQNSEVVETDKVSPAPENSPPAERPQEQENEPSKADEPQNNDVVEVQGEVVSDLPATRNQSTNPAKEQQEQELLHLTFDECMAELGYTEARARKTLPIDAESSALYIAEIVKLRALIEIMASNMARSMRRALVLLRSLENTGRGYLRGYASKQIDFYKSGKKVGKPVKSYVPFDTGNVIFRQTGGVQCKDERELMEWAKTTLAAKIEKIEAVIQEELEEIKEVYGEGLDLKLEIKARKKPLKQLLVSDGLHIPGFAVSPVDSLGKMEISTSNRSFWKLKEALQPLKELEVLFPELGKTTEEEEE